MKKELHNILFKDGKFIRNRFRENWFKKNNPELYNKIIKSVSNEFSFKEKLYIIYHDIESPKCKICDNMVDLWSFEKGFKTYCSVQCLGKDEEIKKRKKQTYIEKYGVDNPNKSEIIKEKKKKTNIEKYGVDTPLKSVKIQEKIKKTNIEKYGTKNPFQSEEIKNKIKRNFLKKHGVEHSSQIFEVTEKRKKTFLKKYGVDNPNKSDTIKEKKKNTKIEKYLTTVCEKIGIDKRDISILDNGNLKISGKCKIHSSFEISKQNLYNRIKYGIKNICTKCNPISETFRIKENELFNFINSIGVNKIYFNTRKILKSGQELDVYFPEHKIAIEFNGLYWHSDLFKDKNYHYNKTIECEKQNIQLIHIFEDEWMHNSDIVKSVIKNKLGFTKNRIYGRKCEVREISDNKLIREFLNKNHIQGFIGSKIKIGLFYNNELVGLMTFGKKRKIMGSLSNVDEYEILRYCNKLDYNIIGGASKLFNFFIKKYEPKEIITYADRRYSNGNVYEKLGMSFVNETPPNYWYFTKNDLIRKYRFGFRKDILVKEGYDSTKTEKEIMIERGYYRIYDCGNNKYIWNELKKS